MSKTWNKTWKQDENHKNSESYTSLDEYFSDTTSGSQTAQILAGMDNGVNFYEGMGDNLPEGYSYVSPEIVTIWKHKDKNGNSELGKSQVQVKRPMGRWLNGDSIPVMTAGDAEYIMNVDVYEEIDNKHSITLNTDANGNVTGYSLDGKNHTNHSKDPAGEIIIADESERCHGREQSEPEFPRFVHNPLCSVQKQWKRNQRREIDGMYNSQAERISVKQI